MSVQRFAVNGPQAVPVIREGDETATVKVTAGSTIRYGYTPKVTTSSYAGSITVGNELDFTRNVWIVSVDKSEVQVTIEDTVQGTPLDSVARASGGDDGQVAHVDTEQWVLRDPQEINVGLPPYNLTAADASPEVKIRQALATARANVIAGSGPTKVHVPAGLYDGIDLSFVDGQVHGSFDVYAALWVDSGVTLKGDGPCATILKLKDDLAMPDNSGDIGNRGSFVIGRGAWRNDGHRLEGATIEGITFDCNGAEHHATSQADAPYFSPGQVVTEGVMITYGVGCTVRDVWCKNLYGTAGGPPGETFHFCTFQSIWTRFENCRAFTDDGSNSATGFTDYNSYGTSWSGCAADGMTKGHGWAIYQGAGQRLTGCIATRCVEGAGFNVEIANDVSFAGCIAGGQSPTYLNGNTQHPDFASEGTNLGNRWGFLLQGPDRVTIGDDCQANYNEYEGCKIIGNASVTPRKAARWIKVRGTMLANWGGTVTTTSNPVTVERASDGGSAIDMVDVDIDVHTYTDFAYGHRIMGDAPVYQAESIGGSSGIRHIVKNRYNWLWRLFSDYDRATRLLGVSSSGQLGSTGRIRNYRAVSGSVTANARDDIIACTGTGTTAQTITLPTAADTVEALSATTVTVYGAGRRLTVKDAAGGAASHNITITPAGGETIEGLSSWTIDVAYGMVELVSNGTNWVVLNRSASSPETAYRRVKLGKTRLSAQATTSGIALHESGGGSTSGVNAANGVFYFDPADFALRGRTSKMKIRALIVSNDTAPGCTFTFRLKPVTASSGASSSANSITVGSAITGSSVAAATPSANAQTVVATSDFDVPTAGPYILEVATDNNMGANACVDITCDLLLRNV